MRERWRRGKQRERSGRRVLAVLLLLWSSLAAAGDRPPTAAPLVLARAESADAAVARDNGVLPALAGDAVAVVYPDLAEPFRSVFNNVIEGMTDELGPVRRFPVTSGSDPAALTATLRRAGVRVVVALGRQGLKAARGLPPELPVIAGGIISGPQAMSEGALDGISLVPDPAVLFTHVRELLPGLRRVIVVYNPGDNDWLIALARQAARNQGLELVALEARDVATAARHYRAALPAADGRRDALWMPQDTITADEEAMLPLVLRLAWAHDVPLVSSSFPHVKKGALLALYPDNRALGRALARRAVRRAGDASEPLGLMPLQDVLTALNLRTASHLGLKIDYRQQRRFDFVYPEP